MFGGATADDIRKSTVGWRRHPDSESFGRASMTFHYDRRCRGLTSRGIRQYRSMDISERRTFGYVLYSSEASHRIDETDLSIGKVKLVPST